MMVVFFTILSLLAIWEVVEVQQFLQKSVFSLLVIFIAAAILLFIFSVVMPKDDNNQNNQPNQPPKF
jgi:preprotein translocase subunit SecG